MMKCVLNLVGLKRDNLQIVKTIGSRIGQVGIYIISNRGAVELMLDRKALQALMEACDKALDELNAEKKEA